MNIFRALSGSLTLGYQDEEWAQTIDYDHIPFRCRKFHEHGHLFMDFPLNAPQRLKEENQEKPKDNFTHVEGRKKTKKKLTSLKGKKLSTINSFEVLNYLLDSKVVGNSHQFPGKDNTRAKAKNIPELVPEQIIEKKNSTQPKDDQVT